MEMDGATVTRLPHSLAAGEQEALNDRSGQMQIGHTPLRGQTI
jgi:hypothetical protein